MVVFRRKGVKKKGICFKSWGLLLTILSLLSSLWLVSVVTVLAAGTHANPMMMTRGSPDQGLSLGPIGNPPLPGETHQTNTQDLHANHDGSNDVVTIGSHQGNTGNQGLNQGFNQDNGGNTGNEISSQRKAIGVQVNRQFIEGDNSGGTSNTTNIGFDQGNTGNQGVNNGFNQDASGNNGNQVNNQGTIIGTQINQQGSDVNNNGSIILHQVNYMNLLPSIQLSSGILPRPHFNLKVN